MSGKVALLDFERYMELCDRHAKLDRERMIGRVAIAHMAAIKTALADAQSVAAGGEVDKDSKDAERYRWLQKQSGYRVQKILNASIADTGDVIYFLKEKFDAEVDAALATQHGDNT